MHIHVLGICGTFMGGVAALAREAGHRVTGCDTNVYPPMSDQLRALGIELIEGFDAGQLALKPDVFVIGNVVKRGNPLMEAILNAGLPYTSGPQWLAEHVLNGRHVLAVAGTHGKTTTTSMLAWILESCGMKPGFLVGGVPENFGISARLGLSGSGMPFVIEADEYDTAFFDKRSKFVHYRPRTVILNNLEYDHADIFPDLAAIETQFHHLVRTVAGQGRIIVNGMFDSLQRVMARGCWSEQAWFAHHQQDVALSWKKSVQDGAQVSPLWTYEGEASEFLVLKDGQDVGKVVWPLQGEHNQLNAVAAVAAAQHLGISAADGAKALAGFESVKRRMEVKGVVGDVVVFDDFAHHPTAIRTTVDGLRRQMVLSNAQGRIFAVFEPRSNTMKLGTMSSQLPWALEHADVVFCYDHDLGWDVRAALQPIADKTHVVQDLGALVAQVVAMSQPRDRILCMSNGGFGGIHSQILQALKAKFAKA